MLQFFVGTHIRFMRWRFAAYLLSATVILAGIVWLLVNGGPRMGVDFAGGTLIEIGTSRPLPVEDVRSTLEGAGLQGAEIQSTGHGNELLLRFARQGSAQGFVTIQRALETRFPGVKVELRREETVGPKVGSELAQKAVWAILGSLGGILLYVGIRYEFKFALGAVLAILHDVFVAFTILNFAGREMSLTVVAALLTLAGFSVNDTIVIFDRIRERLRSASKESHERAIDAAVNETLSRTIITSLTVLFTSVALYVFGGEVINDFALAMVVGVITGSYSTVYVASGLALEAWNMADRRRRPARARAA